MLEARSIKFKYQHSNSARKPQEILNNEIFELKIVLIASKTIKDNRVLNHVDFQMEETIKW